MRTNGRGDELAELAAPTLEDLRDAPEAAWLWDGARARIVWANAPGLAFFGADSLFDLLDRPFDLAEPGVARIAGLARSLRRGEMERALLHFPSAGADVPMACRCMVHALADGRPGLLVIAPLSSAEETVKATQDVAAAFDLLPSAAVLLGPDGALRHLNAAALAVLGPAQRSGFSAILGDAALAESLLARVEAAGTVAITRKLSMRLGQRDMRLTLKRLNRPEPDAAFAMLLLDDVTERRALERQLSATETREPAAAPAVKEEAAPPPAPVAAAPAAPAAVEPPAAETPAPPPPEPAATPPTGRSMTETEAAMFEQLGRTVEEAIRQLPLRAAEPAPPPVAEAPSQPAPAEPPAAPPALQRHSAEVIQLPLRQHGAEADQELKAILDTAADGIITLDSEGRIHTFSAGAEAIFGYRIAEVAGKPLLDFLAPESRKTVRDYLAALQGPGLAAVFNDGREVTALVRQGGTVPLFLTIGKLEAPRSSAAFCAVVRDITQWKKTEAELREAKERAEATSRQKSEFLASVSHELRTPLNAIMGFSEVMRLGRFGEIDNEKYRGYVQDIHASGAHLLSLINDLLDLSKVEAGKLELNFTSVNLGDVAEHAMKLLQEQATAARVVLRKSFPADLPNVVADLRSMRQVMLNLVSNAIKFTDPGGQVVISAQLLGNGELKLKVKDTGIGMDEDQLKDALQPFRRVVTEGREVQGTGLGLPLTKALTEANRASLKLSSEPRKGTLAEVTFPVTRVLAE
jgi:PAS domain S-box-containing protein